MRLRLSVCGHGGEKKGCAIAPQCATTETGKGKTNEKKEQERNEQLRLQQMRLTTQIQVSAEGTTEVRTTDAQLRRSAA